MSILKLKDSQGNWISVPTLKGDKGNGIQSAVLNNDYTLTLTFTDGTTYTTPSIRGEKGEQGEPATDMDIHICSASEYDSETRIPTITSPDDKTFYLVPTKDGTSPDLFTEWIYVNNAWEMFGSMKIDLSGYVKDTDYATGAKAGVIKLNPNYGINVTNDGILYVNTAESKNAKMGTNNARPITPIIQHESTFYGLAKVAGHDEKDSTLPVGQYTDEAKSSIQDMLDVPSNADLDEVEEKVEQNTEDLLKAFPIETASGNIASFEDGANGLPLQSLVVDINPVQDLRGYDSPWPAGGGKNILPYATIESPLIKNGITFVRSQDGSIAVNGTSTASFAQTFVEFALQPGSYYFNCGNSFSMQQNTYAYIRDIDNGITLASITIGNIGTDRAFSIDVQTNVRFYMVFGQTGLVISGTLYPMIRLASITDATYVPYSNICPISGWTECEVSATGYNVWDEQWENGRYTGGEKRVNSLMIRSKNYIPVKPSTTYYFNKGAKNGNMWVYFYDRDKVCLNPAGNGTNVGNRAVTTPDKCYYANFFLSEQTEYQHDVTINYPSTDHDYHSYVGQTIPINWQTEAGTVYGGTLNVLTGELTIDRAMVDLGTLNWSTYPLASNCFKALLRDGKVTRTNYSADGICSSYVKADYITTLRDTDKTFGIGYTNLSAVDCYVAVHDSSYSDAAAFKTAMSGVQLCYELATPIEIQLTPNQVNSLLGVNNIWADTGNTFVEYHADPELYIEKVKPVVNVDDVQINGTSIIENGVANIPLADNNKFGVVKLNGNYGIQKNSTNLAVINRGNDSEIKIGTNSYKPIVPYSQHQSVFYGLAKASGDTTQSASSNTVGNYTDNAKSSIQNMLGITDKYSPKEWVAESETELVTNAHNIGDLFYIGETLYKVIADLNAGDAVNVGVNVEEVNANDILDDYATKEDVQDNVSIVEKSASGSIASFTDGADNLPLKSLVVDINPIQDLHGQENPYPAGSTANQLDLIAATYARCTLVDVYTGSVRVNITNAYFAAIVFQANAMPTAMMERIFNGEPITFELDNNNGYSISIVVYGTRSNGSSYQEINGYNNFVTITPTLFTAVTSIEFRFQRTGAQHTDTTTVMTGLRVSYGDTATTFQPYENICPISGWTEVDVEQRGKNLFDQSSFEWGNSQLIKYVTMPIPNGTYTLSTDMPDREGSTRDVFVFAGQVESGASSANNGVSITSPRTITVTDGHSTIANRNGVTVDDYNWQLEEGSTATEYSPYAGRSINIQLGQTVYGGKLDVLTGELVVDMAMVDLGTLDWITTDSGRHRTSGLSSAIKRIGNHELMLGACSSYKLVVGNAAANTDMSLSQINLTNILINDSRYNGDDATAFKTAMSGVQLVYELATPIEIQLTPNQLNSLYGVNNIWADSGDTSIEYFSQVDEDLIDYIETSLKPYAKEERLNDYVSDVQVNGSSIVTDGVANIPMASANKLGAVSVNGSYYGVSINPQDGGLYLSGATDSAIKDGNATYRVVFPSKQHQSVFYGLAKVAGHDEKDSELPVGQYTDEAKTAIKQMLGIHDTIDSFVEEVAGTDATITGQPSYRYNCGELYSLTVTPPESGTIDIRFTSGSTPTVLTLPSTVKMPEWWVEVEANTIYEMCITDRIYCGVMTWTM